MGGATAIGVAAERPELVSCLVLMGSAGVTRHLPPVLKPLIHYDFTREGMVALMRILCTERFKIDDEMVDYRYAGAIQPETRRAYGEIMGWVRQAGGLYYEDDFIRQVSAPTLIVNGKQDKVVPLSDAMRLLELIPRSWAYFIPDCGHWAMLEHPRDFARATLNFLDNTRD
jgi:2-hydroxy-6-oxo-6-(2'-aminophenyl)hexa-2,4-dienoate hydrolase